MTSSAVTHLYFKSINSGFLRAIEAYPKHRENCESCPGNISSVVEVSSFFLTKILLKYGTIITIPTDTVATVTITSVTNITTVTVTTVTITTVTSN